MTLEGYHRIAEKYGVTVQWDTENDCVNRSWCSGRDIFLGQYDDEELRCISFFHELGHSVTELPPFEDWPYSHYDEAVAWRVGLALAEAEGLAFSDIARAWAATELLTYFHDHNPEGCPTRFAPMALRDAGLQEERKCFGC